MGREEDGKGMEGMSQLLPNCYFRLESCTASILGAESCGLDRCSSFNNVELFQNNLILLQMSIHNGVDYLLAESAEQSF